jgi:hypothetical protein
MSPSTHLHRAGHTQNLIAGAPVGQRPSHYSDCGGYKGDRVCNDEKSELADTAASAGTSHNDNSKSKTAVMATTEGWRCPNLLFHDHLYVLA